jgi:hypothetical protein
MREGSVITGNRGGGVYMSLRSTFTMNGGKISGNTRDDGSGGGVYVSAIGTFTMSGGEISGNAASIYGGGVCVSDGTFTMSGGEISGNTLNSNYSDRCGGGVYVRGTFTKTGGGTIYGYTEGDSKSNVVKNDYGVVQNNKGHAVYVRDTVKREKTVGSTEMLKWENYTATGDWTDP